MDQDLNDHRANPVINRSEIRDTAIAKMHILCNVLFIDAIG